MSSTCDAITSTPKKLQKIGKSVSKSQRAGLVFPVGRTHRLLKAGQYSKKVGVGAAIYLSAVTEYLCAEILEMAGTVASDNGKARIVPRHIMQAIQGDNELRLLLKNIIIADAGVMPTVHLVKRAKKQDEALDEVV